MIVTAILRDPKKPIVTECLREPPTKNVPNNVSEPGSKIATNPKRVILVTKSVGFRNNWTPKKEDHLSGKNAKWTVFWLMLHRPLAIYC